jgi:hypothetical protein
MPSDVFTTQQEVTTLDRNRIHVVVVGAGASLAAFPNGDRSGRKLPIIKNFVDVVGLAPLLKANHVPAPYDDFEAIYSDAAGDPNKVALQNELEERVYDYFSALELPDEPTLYDHLILSLRAKDVIATFNWDPFLWNAAARNAKFAKPPTLLFLHGNVAIGYCPDCKSIFRSDQRCSDCGKPTVASPLLYPVKQKNYQSDPAIAGHWRTLMRALKCAWAITFFGYGAPRTDVEAVELLKKGWGDAECRLMEETEIIDIRSESDLTAKWAPFIHSHHFAVRRSFYDSYIAKHPRRSCEAIWQRVAMARFVEDGSFPQDMDFNALHAWLRPRAAAE